MTKNKIVIPIIIVLVLIIIAVILGVKGNISGYDSETQPASITSSPDEGLKAYDGETIIDTNFLAFTSASTGCSKESSFRADYVEGRKAGVGDEILRVTKYGTRCDVGDRIVMYACQGNSYNPGKCYRLFGEDYVKEFAEDTINLNVECGKGSSDGISNCYDRAWYTSLINDRYVGYDCLSCNDNYGEATIQIVSADINKNKVVVGQEYVIEGTAKIKGGDVHNAVIETGIEFYGVPLSFNDFESGRGACNDDLTVGVKFSAEDGDIVGFKLRDTPLEVGSFKVPVYAMKGCFDEIGGSNQVVYDTVYLELEVVADSGNSGGDDDDVIIELVDPMTCYWCIGTELTKEDLLVETCPVGTSQRIINCQSEEDQENNAGPEKEIWEKTWFIALAISFGVLLLVVFTIAIIRRRSK